jgi:hypothetical protein
MSQLLGFEIEVSRKWRRRCFSGDRETPDLGVGCSLLEVTGEVQLRARPASGRGLLQPVAAFPKILPAVASNSSYFPPDEKVAVVICENDITYLPFDPPPWQKGLQSKRLFWMKMRNSL